MIIALFVLLGLTALWYGTFYAYVLVVAAKQVRDRGMLTGFHKAMFWPLLAIAYPLDILFNAVHGTAMFREWPQWHRREFTFTARCKRHVALSLGRRRRLALFWRKQLNPFEEGHI